MLQCIQAAILGAAPLMRVHQSCRHSRSFNLLSLIDQATLRNCRAFFFEKKISAVYKWKPLKYIYKWTKISFICLLFFLVPSKHFRREGPSSPFSSLELLTRWSCVIYRMMDDVDDLLIKEKGGKL